MHKGKMGDTFSLGSVGMTGMGGLVGRTGSGALDTTPIRSCVSTGWPVGAGSLQPGLWALRPAL